MTATITIQELLTFIIYLLGIGLLVYLIMLIKNANKLVLKARRIVEENEREIDTTLKQLPEISVNINDITEDVKKLIQTVSPEVRDLITNTSSITDKLDTTSEKVFDAVDLVSDSLSKTAITIQDNVRNITDYIKLIIEIIEIIKNALKK